MLDLYELIVPCISVFILLNLLALKLAIKDNVTLIKIYEKNLESHYQKCQKPDQSPTKNTLKYILLNFTPIELFAVRRAKYKLSLFLSLSIILISTYFVPSPYAFIGTGTIVYFTYFFINMAITRLGTQPQQPQGIKKHRQKYLQLIFTIISIVLNIIIVEDVFKNYQNNILISFLTNAGLNIVLDNFLVRPFLVVIISLLLSRNASVQQYLAECQKWQNMLDIYDTLGKKEMLLQPCKTISQTKLAKTIPSDIQIEPRPIDHEILKKQQKEYETPLDMLKKVKKDKILPPINIDFRKSLGPQCTLNSLFGSCKKQQEEQVEEPIEGHILKQKTINGFQFLQKKKVCSQNLIMINPSQQQPVENEQDLMPQEINKKINENSDPQDRMRSNIRKESINALQNSSEPLKIKLHSSDNNLFRQSPLRVFLNGEINLDSDFEQNQHDDDQNDPYRNDPIDLAESSHKNSFEMLQINKAYNDNEIAQINLNRPERLRRQEMNIIEEHQYRKSVSKKRKKKHSHDNNRIIKFSTGEPYLEYLPYMLAKEAKNKKSQAFSKKDMIFNHRDENSVRKHKKRTNEDNTQNIVPQFKIEQL